MVKMMAYLLLVRSNLHDRELGHLDLERHKAVHVGISVVRGTRRARSIFLYVS